MTTQSTTGQLTYEDYGNFPDDGQRHELINGNHYGTSPPVTQHQRIAINLATTLPSHCQHTKQGWPLIATTEYPDSKFLFSNHPPKGSHSAVFGILSFPEDHSAVFGKLSTLQQSPLSAQAPIPAKKTDKPQPRPLSYPGGTDQNQDFAENAF